MTPEQADARKKRFDEVRKYCDTPEHYRKAYLQFLRDFYYTMDINLDTLALSLKGIKEALSPVNPSTGWQMEIHQIFKRTLFKKVRQGQITPADAIRTYANDLPIRKKVVSAINRAFHVGRIKTKISKTAINADLLP
jgi:hypothetical protein